MRHSLEPGFPFQNLSPSFGEKNEIFLKRWEKKFETESLGLRLHEVNLSKPPAASIRK